MVKNLYTVVLVGCVLLIRPVVMAQEPPYYFNYEANVNIEGEIMPDVMAASMRTGIVSSLGYMGETNEQDFNDYFEAEAYADEIMMRQSNLAAVGMTETQLNNSAAYAGGVFTNLFSGMESGFEKFSQPFNFGSVTGLSFYLITPTLASAFGSNVMRLANNGAGVQVVLPATVVTVFGVLRLFMLVGLSLWFYTEAMAIVASIKSRGMVSEADSSEHIGSSDDGV
jgi:hypothetical protein